MDKLFNIYDINTEEEFDKFLENIDQSSAVVLSIQANMKASYCGCFNEKEEKILLKCIEKILNVKEEQKL